MLAAVLSVAGLTLAIAAGYFLKVNIGMVSIAFAFLIGHFLVGLPSSTIVTGWPLNLFFMLLAMTLLFGIARVNGTLGLIAQKVVEATRGRTRLIPPAFFLMSGILAALGAGNISICALVLPIAMTISAEQKIPALLMATMVIAGANAGGLSPIAPTGIIGVTLSEEIGLHIGIDVFYKQIIGQSLLAAILYFILRGHRLKNSGDIQSNFSARFNRDQKTTLAVFLLVVSGIIFAGMDIGLTAFTGSVVLLLLKTADEKHALEAVPWSTLILVSGVGMLVRVAEAAGGIQIMAEFLTSFMTQASAGPIMAVIGGMLSIVSSASGVVMPTLIPAVPGIVSEIGGDPVRIISAIIMGAHVVTNSPISTLGALAVAAVAAAERDRLFKNLFIFALLGLVYAAIIVYIGLV